MTFMKFTHTLLKHCQASQRPNMKCMEREKEKGIELSFI